MNLLDHELSIELPLGSHLELAQARARVLRRKAAELQAAADAALFHAREASRKAQQAVLECAELARLEGQEGPAAPVAPRA